ncbi:uncharacterized protein [Triticum aestivum]|uniref:uncharacterized protein n=1 Tax=Triticum aestivum TaxID=4565 RepID=UPI001D01EC3B|nr:uncharacterized protein LOC123190740 [Triticum aestivum]
MGQARCAALAQGGAAVPRAAARRVQRVDGAAAAAWTWWQGVLAWGRRGSSGCFVRSGGRRRGLRRRGLGAAAGLAGPAPGVVELLIHGVAASGGSRGMAPVGSAGSSAGVPSSGEGWGQQEPWAAGVAVLRSGSAGGMVVAVAGRVRPGVRPGLLPGLGVRRGQAICGSSLDAAAAVLSPSSTDARRQWPLASWCQSPWWGEAECFGWEGR